MTLGEFRKLTSKLPDQTEFVEPIYEHGSEEFLGYARMEAIVYRLRPRPRSRKKEDFIVLDRDYSAPGGKMTHGAFR